MLIKEEGVGVQDRQNRNYTRTSPAGHGGAAVRSVMAEALWESPNPTSIFHFVSRLSSVCPLSQHQMRPIRRSRPL